ncbi:MAG: hypothetical protein LUC91_07820, partial [Prevotella sp.]|nr:hypothetical protein [Prevotella sp.]
MMQKIYEALAAVAVFGDLYDKSKDIYDVLAGYLRLVIVSEHKADFTAAEITDRVNVANAFDINESVVKRGLKRLGIPLSKRIYHVDPEFFEGTEINDLDEQIEQNQNLLEDLFGFIRARNGEQDLSTEERNEIQSQFFEYLLNDSYSGTYSIDISNYIVAASKNAEVFSTINRIKEGTLVYEGITYSSEVDSCHTWNTELAICIEMEVLFYIAGYNGDIYKSMYEQLLDYIDEINQSRGKGRKYISLFYTYTVQDEIEGYFRKAEMIFGKGEAIDPSKKPLRFILEGVTRKQDIQLKKAKFFNLLNSRDIRPLDVDFYSLENKQYNRIDEKVYTNIISSVQTDRDDDYIKKCIDKVNEIEILRKNMNVRLHDVKYILLTANHVILRCAYADDFYQSGEVPKATDLDFLVNRFWFVLNKGFGKGVLPKTIDIVSRAKMVISFNTDAYIENLYNELRNK